MKRMRFFRSLALFLVFTAPLSGFAGCAGPGGEDTDSGVTVVTTLFPLYDFARAVAAGTGVEVSLLLPPGVESHSYEPSPADIISIQNADVFAYTGEYMERWAHDILDGLDGERREAGGFPAIGGLLVADCSRGVALDEIGAHEAAHGHESHSHGNYDPHIWTDPTRAAAMASTLAEALALADPANEGVYRANAEAYREELLALDAAFSALVDGAPCKEICFGGRFALHYFAKRYGISCIAAYDSCSSETEPSAQAVPAITDAIAEKGLPVIYYEELVDPKVSRAIADETGCEMLLLHSCHNISKEELDAGATYLSLMEQNLRNLRVGLYGAGQ